MDHDLGFDLQEAMERLKIKNEDILALRNSNIPGMPKDVSDKLLVLFLDSCGGIEEAKKAMKAYYEERANRPEHFNNKDPQSDEIIQCLDNQDYFMLAQNPDGYPIIFHRLSNSKPSNYIFDSAIKTFYMTIDACLYKMGPRPGIIFLFDMKDVRLSHLTRVRLGTIKQFFYYLQEAMPGKLCQIHVLNVVSFFDKILTMIKPLMRAEIFKNLHTYPSNMNYEEFYKKAIPKTCLPSDFGGDLGSVQELRSAFRVELFGLRNYFMAEEQQRNEHKKKVGYGKKSNDTKTIESTFKGLEID